MSNTTSNSTGGGIGFAGLLTCIFVALRLIPTGNPSKHQHIINWSWWWVLSPLWISWALALVIIALVLIFVAVLTKD